MAPMYFSLHQNCHAYLQARNKEIETSMQCNVSNFVAPQGKLKASNAQFFYKID
jgi:hypothetical protein